MTQISSFLKPAFKPFLYRQVSICIVSALLISGCSSDTSDKPLSKIKPLSVADSQLPTELKTIYTQTCAICHTKDTTGAPVAGDTQQWNKVLSKGMEQVLENVINGYGGMPPGGQCFECSPEQLIELTNFMANRHIGAQSLEAQSLGAQP